MSEENLQALADISRLLATSSTVSETLSNLLRLLTETFDGEGAILWTEDDTERSLKQRQSMHLPQRRSKAFEEEVAAQTIGFGQSLAGEVWAEGTAKLFQYPALFSATMHPGFLEENDEALSVCLAFPLYGAGSITGVVEVVGCSLAELDAQTRTFLSIIGTQIGAFMSAHDAVAGLQRLESNANRLAERMRGLEEDLRSCKARVSRLHDEAMQDAASKRRSLTDISSEIRTPLSGILGVVELLKRSKLSDQQSELSAIIQDSAEMIVDVLTRLVESGDHQQSFGIAKSNAEEESVATATKESVSLNQARILVVNGLIGSTEFIEAFATASGITCDAAGRGYSALTALRQAQGAGRPFNVVFIEQVLPDMDAFEFAKIVRDERELSGISLILVSTFGSIDSAPGAAEKAGFTAHIAKPIKQAQVLNAVEAVLRGTSIEAAVQSTQIAPMPAIIEGKRVILVAEDNPVNQRVALLQLQELGYCAEVVANGKEAVEAAKLGAFDAILMDLQMPDMDGYQATREIRAWEAGKDTHIPIIAMTARVMPADREKCVEAGMDDYMSKPVTYDKLYSVLSNWLNVDEAKQEEAEWKSQEASMEKPINSQIDFNPQVNDTAESAAPVDVPMLTEMLGPEEATEILKLFVESSEELMDKINVALNTHDVNILKEAAHTLKGACSSVGANSMWKDCIELEQAAKTADWSKIPATYTVLEQAFAQAKSFIQTII